MKIHPNIVTANVGSSSRSRDASAKPGDRPDASTERVEVSSAARFVERVRRAMQEESETVRPLEVARVREALAAGTYESSVDLDRVVDGLLGDL